MTGLGYGNPFPHLVRLVRPENLAFLYHSINTYMPKQGIRPHTWKVQGEIPHQQHIAWQRAKAQANFRGELWMLTFEQYQQCWLGQWERRGRASDDVCLVREDPDGAWEPSNVSVIPRIEHLRRQRLYKSRNTL